MLHIEKNVPLPPARAGGTKYPFDEMQPGDSFIVPEERAAKNLRAAVQKYQKTTGEKFTIRKVKDGWRCWLLSLFPIAAFTLILSSAHPVHANPLSQCALPFIGTGCGAPDMDGNSQFGGDDAAGPSGAVATATPPAKDKDHDCDRDHEHGRRDHDKHDHEGHEHGGHEGHHKGS